MMWLVVFVAAVLAALWFVLGPLLGPRRPLDAMPTRSELDLVLAEKAQTLRALKDLEAERLAAHIDAAAFEAARQEWLARAVLLNRRIAELTGVPVADALPSPAPESGPGPGEPPPSPPATAARPPSSVSSSASPSASS